MSSGDLRGAGSRQDAGPGDERWTRGTATYASQFGIPDGDVFEYMAGHFGERMAIEAILAAGGAWRDDTLSLRDRSLVVLSALVTQGAVDDRLALHVRWACEHGLEPEEIEAAVTLLGVYAGYPRASVAMEIVRRVLSDGERDGPGP